MSELETLAAAIELERITIKICHLLQSQIDDCKQEAKEEMSKAA